MAAKVLLGVVALTAIVGSPFAYNHFKTTSGETQKEEEKTTDKQPVAAEKPANSVPEVAAQEENQRAAEQSGAVQNPKDDECKLGERKNWESTGGILSGESQCVRKVVLEQREQH